MSHAIPPSNLSMTVTPANPLELLSRAVMGGAAPETLEKLLALQERWERSQARKAFDVAIAAAKAEIPTIKKNREVSFGAGKTAYRHEDLAEIERTVVGPLSKHGLSYRFRTAVTDKLIVVTCIISHRDGHFEENSLPGPADTSGSKNAIQAIGSACTYLQRYTLKAALGLSASHDDDAVALNGAGPLSSDEFFINQQQRDELSRMLTLTGRPTELFLKKFNLDDLGELPASKYDAVLAFLANYIPKDEK